MHITVMLTARSDGSKCKPFVLLNRKRQMPEIVKKYKGKLILCWEGKTWMNNSLTADYLRRTFGPSFCRRRLLVWDSFRCHISQETKKILKELELDTAVIPGGCTKFIQVIF
jgi:DDE superfamily endonuclease